MANEEQMQQQGQQQQGQQQQPGRQPGQPRQQWVGRTNLWDNSERELIVMKLSYSFLQSLCYTMLLASLFILQQKKTTLENIQSSIGKLPFSNEELKIVATKFKEHGTNIQKKMYAFILTILAIVIALAINDTNNVGLKFLMKINGFLVSYSSTIMVVVAISLFILIGLSLYLNSELSKITKGKWIANGLLIVLITILWIFHCLIIENQSAESLKSFYLYLIIAESITVSLYLIVFSSSLIKKSVHINKYIELEERKATATATSGANGTTATATGK